MNNEVTMVAVALIVLMIQYLISELRKLNATLEEVKNEISSERES